MGVVSAAGAGKAASLASLATGQRDPSPPGLFDSPLTYPAFEVSGLPAEYALKGQRTLGLAYMALDEALGEAGIKINEANQINQLRVGVCMGTSASCPIRIECAMRSCFTRVMASCKETWAELCTMRMVSVNKHIR